MTNIAPNPEAADAGSARYMIVSADSHVGPLLREQLRDYCPPSRLADFDAFVDEWEPTRRPSFADDGKYFTGTPFTHKVQDRVAATTATDGVFDPDVRLADMDADGIAAEVIYHGAMTPEIIPWQMSADPELQTLGCQIYNRWLADFVAVDPNRLIGAVQTPIWDVDATVKEVEFGAEHGLKAVNFPAPNRSFAPYNDPVYEPFWVACADTGLPLTTHGGGGDMPQYTGPEAWALMMSDCFQYSRRGLFYLVWSGVFERHPELRLIFTEQRSEWVPDVLAHLDSIYASEFHDWKAMIPRPPSEYFRDQCYVASSFMARFEAERRHDVGIDRLMWGSDYPHYEGCYGNTQLCLRQTFAGMPTDEVARILGENAIDVFGLDRAPLRRLADRIGPLVDEVDQPLPRDDFPDTVGCAFRTISTWA